MILLWIIYHIWLHFNLKSNPRLSSYRDEITDKLSLPKILVPFRRAFVNLLINVVIMLTFSFSAKSGLNQGIASSIFSTCLIFVAAYFYFKEGQKLSGWDALGITMVILCVVLISISGKAKEEKT